jgi:hypothetical protein
MKARLGVIGGLQPVKGAEDLLDQRQSRMWDRVAARISRLLWMRFHNLVSIKG